ncbi:hypothetical protein MRX96_008870 [Rhipicephalus microplus]
MHRYQGVLGVIATLSNGMVIMSTMPDKDDTNRYARMAASLLSEEQHGSRSHGAAQLLYGERREPRDRHHTRPTVRLIVVKEQQEPLEEASQELYMR